jgi:uncharacterized Fe-S center protein
MRGSLLWPPSSAPEFGEAAAGLMKPMGPAKCGFVNAAVDATPLCDCDPLAGEPFVQDLGVLASHDALALDRACADIVGAAPRLPNPDGRGH